jgi:large subunit ribosomal protein L29
MKKDENIRDMSIDEINAHLLKLRKEQFNLRMQKANGTLEKTHQITSLRRAIAKAKTIMTEKAGK